MHGGEQKAASLRQHHRIATRKAEGTNTSYDQGRFAISASAGPVHRSHLYESTWRSHSQLQLLPKFFSRVPEPFARTACKSVSARAFALGPDL